MKKTLFSLLAGLVMTVVSYGQVSLNQTKTTDGYYSVPVPSELMVNTAAEKSGSQMTVKQVKGEKVNYKVQIRFEKQSKKETVYSLGIISDNLSVNKKLADLNSTVAKPGNLYACYKEKKKAVQDWQALAECTVQYVQVFL